MATLIKSQFEGIINQIDEPFWDTFSSTGAEEKPFGRRLILFALKSSGNDRSNKQLDCVWSTVGDVIVSLRL